MITYVTLATLGKQTYVLYAGNNYSQAQYNAKNYNSLGGFSVLIQHWRNGEIVDNEEIENAGVV